MVDKSSLGKLKRALDFSENDGNANTFNNCTITLPHDNENYRRNSESSSDFSSCIAESHYPRIEAVFGEYVEINSELADLLNKDLRIYPELLPFVSDLHASCCVLTDNVTAKSYSKYTSTDLHTGRPSKVSVSSADIPPSIFVGVKAGS